MVSPIDNPCDLGTPEPCGVNPAFQYTRYPCDFDDPRSTDSRGLPTIVDLQTPVRAEVVNRHRESILALEIELGIQPSGAYTTVRDRLDVLENFLCTLYNSGGIGGGGGIGGYEPVHEALTVSSNGQTVFTLSQVPDIGPVLLWIGGVKQAITEYTVLGNQLTWVEGTTILTTDIVEVLYFIGTDTGGGDGYGDGYVSWASTLGVGNVTDGTGLNNPTLGINDALESIDMLRLASGGDINFNCVHGSGINTPGGSLLSQSGNGTGTGSGGYVIIQAGSSEDIRGGDAFLIAGDSDNGPGGDAYLQSGLSITGNGGESQLIGGSGGVNGGRTSLRAGNGGTGLGGNCNLYAGNSTSGKGGLVNITAGTSSSSDGGDVNIQSGSGSINGFIFLQSNITILIPKESGDPAILSTDNLTLGSDPTDDLIFKSGNQSATGDSGNIVINTGSSASGSTGTILIESGSFPSSGNKTGDVTIRTGQHGSSDGSGDLLIESGGNGAGDSGNVTLQTGTGVGNDSGSILIQTGNAGAGDSGNIIINVGNPGGGSKGSLILNGLIWPDTDGLDGYALTTDGSGNLSFSDVNGLDFLSSPDGTFSLGSVSTENQQLEAALADSADHTLNIQLLTNSKRYFVTWFLMIEGLSYRYFVEYDRNGAGVLTVVDEFELGGSLPTDVTVVAAVDGDDGQLVVSNATGAAIRSLGNATFASQSV